MNRPRVTLVGPLTWRGVSDGCELQLGLLSLAAILAPRGIRTEIVDLNLFPDSRPLLDQALEAILATRPDVVGFGSICSSYPFTLRLADAVKQVRADVIVIFGGPQASVVDQSTMLAFPCVDFVVRGEAEQSLPQLLDALSCQTSLSGIAGITYRRDRRILRNPNASPIADLDSLPLPLYGYYQDLDRRSLLPIEAGRGCPFACRFCSTNDFFRRKFRLKSAAKLVSEMALLAARYGVREFQLTHDMFTVDRKRVVAFCEELLEHGGGLGWRCSARTDCVDADLLALMQRAGCTGIFFGIETGSQRLQQVIDKNLDLRQSRTILEDADRLGIETTASLITGYPQEQPEDLDGTLAFFGEAIRLDRCDPQLHLLSPLAETPLSTEYRDQLVYDRIASDISGPGDRLHAIDELLVVAHPELFPNFYAFPCPIDRAYLQHLRALLLAMSTRAKGLFLALHQECGGLRAVFDDWRAAWNREPSLQAYETWQFFREFLDFVESRYLGSGKIAVEVLWRFYSALETDANAAATLTDAPVSETSVRVSPAMRIVTVRGDVLEALDCLRNGAPVARELADRVCTLAVEIAYRRRGRILQLPPLSATILRHCRCLISISDLGQKLEIEGCRLRDLEKAIEILETQGLLTVTQPTLCVAYAG